MIRHVLERPEGRLVLDVHGTHGRPVVCLPGIGDLRATWRRLAPLLAEAGHVVYSVDSRGHGESDATFSDHGPEALGDDVVALLEAFDLHDAVLVGNSMGAAAAAHAALAVPHRVGALVFLAPFVRVMPADRWMRPLVPLLFAAPWGAAAWSAYRRTLFRTLPEDLDEDVARVRANLAERGRLAAVRGMLRASKGGVEARLGQLRAPTLVIMGAQDPDFGDPEAEGRTVQALVGGPSTLAVFDATGHYPQIERPEATAAAVLAFLADGPDGA